MTSLTGRLKGFLPKTFTARLYWTIVLAIAIPLLGLSMWSKDIAYRMLITEKDKQLIAIADYLDKSLPGTFKDILEKENATNLPKGQQLEIMKNKLQPIIDQVTNINPNVGAGYYDRNVLNSRVAMGPKKLKKNYTSIPENSPLLRVYKEKKIIRETVPTSGVWDGKPVYSISKPIYRNGQIIGHLFVNAKIEDIFLIANEIRYAMLTVAIFLIGLAFLGAKRIIHSAGKSLEEFAEQVKNDSSTLVTNNIFPELSPLLEDIKELNQRRLACYEQEKLAVIGQMAAGMAHEIRNPLTSVKGLTQIISSRLGAENESYNQYLNVIVEEINRANNIIRDFLAFAKPKPPMFQLVSPNSIIEEACILIESQCLMKGIKLVTELDDDLPLCQMDNDQIKQFILNVANNAIDAMEATENKKLILKTGFDKKESKIILVIRDTGQGIPPENIKKLGTPFFTTKSKGTGLGLSVSYKIIENHNGSIMVDSEEGKGTTFKIILPCCMA